MYFLIILSVILHGSLSHFLEPKPNQPLFDFYVFSRVWDPIRERVIIHGLWPTWRNGSWPENCANSSQPWNATLVDDIIPELTDRWSDDGKIDPHWWEHEWTKHGTCAVGSPLISNQLQYFATSLWLDMWLGANGKLNNSGGVTSQPYSNQQLVSIFEATPICNQNQSGFYHYKNYELMLTLT